MAKGKNWDKVGIRRRVRHSFIRYHIRNVLYDIRSSNDESRSRISPPPSGSPVTYVDKCEHCPLGWLLELTISQSTADEKIRRETKKIIIKNDSIFRRIKGIIRISREKPASSRSHVGVRFLCIIYFIRVGAGFRVFRCLIISSCRPLS